MPAATVQDVDVSAADAALAAEIRRLDDLMERGDETPEQCSWWRGQSPNHPLQMCR